MAWRKVEDPNQWAAGFEVMPWDQSRQYASDIDGNY